VARVPADVNADPLDPPGTLKTLNGYEDRSHLKLNVGAIGSFGCTLSKRFVTNSDVALSTAMCAQLAAAKRVQALGNKTGR
jgi:hypothetical protein